MSLESFLKRSQVAAKPAKSAAASGLSAPPLAQVMLLSAPAWDWRRTPTVTLMSVLLHLIALGLCGLIVLENPQLMEEIFTTLTEHEEIGDPIIERSMEVPQEVNDAPQENIFSRAATSNLEFESTGPVALNVSDGIPQVEKGASELPGPRGIQLGNETSGRMSADAKRAMLEKFGGNSASEAAVAAGLKWLVDHQMSNGSWSFEHSKHPGCRGQCSQNGFLKSCPHGATGLALLAFLGAGHTHQAGDYQKEVRRGLDFLLKTGKRSSDGSDSLDLRGFVVRNEGMYVQGLCTIALCECAAMTDDPRIRTAAQGAIEFIVKAQNPVDGGWRYFPRAPGDTSVVGWQVMALKSGYNAKLSFSNKVFKGAETFLDRAQTNRGSQYIYMPGNARRSPDPTETMTAVGLLCRMYLGWDRTNPRLASGVEYLDQVKPQPDNMYFNYYATQVMHHWGGDEWTRWNEVMRDQLIRTQHSQRDGHPAGSWDLADPHGDAGGRHYMTCLSLMTLEVYYRHLPLYNRNTLKVEF